VTTILADAKLGVMVSDSCVSDGDRVYRERKVFRVRGELLGFAGDLNQALSFLAWWRAGCVEKPPKFDATACLILGPSGLIAYHESIIPAKVVSGCASIGTGGKAAMCAYEALGFKNPARAVGIVCRHDEKSRAPVRTYRL